MNRKWFWLLGIVFAAPVFWACAGSPVIFDGNLPLEQSSHISIYYGLEIKTYNGISVPQKTFLRTTTSTWHDVYLPPGEMEFMLDVNWEGAVTRYLAKSVYFKYKFDAGKNYTIIFTAYGGADEDEWGVRIFDSPPPKVGLPKTQDAIAFAPFYKVKD